MNQNETPTVSEEVEQPEEPKVEEVNEVDDQVKYEDRMEAIRAGIPEEPKSEAVNDR